MLITDEKIYKICLFKNHAQLDFIKVNKAKWHMF